MVDRDHLRNALELMPLSGNQQHDLAMVQDLRSSVARRYNQLLCEG